jgi:hypothetical protein
MKESNMKLENVNLDSVTKAAELISSIGIKPTSRLILQRLGHGSMSTVQKYLYAWNEKQMPNIPEAADINLDGTISSSITQHISEKIYEATLKLTLDLQDKASENRQIIDELVEVEDKLSSLTEINEALKEKNAELMGCLEATMQQLDTINQQFAKERNANEQLKIEIAVSQTKQETFEIYKNESTRLSAELANVQHELQLANQKIAAAENKQQKQKDFAKFGEE